jgi:putative ABC transport system substrate-binding protein
VTGFTLFDYTMSAKWLELLKEIAPRVTRAVVIRNPRSPTAIGSSS